jgi:hypothetical protein
MLFFIKIEKSILNSHGTTKDHQTAKTILSKTAMLVVSQYLSSNYTIETKTAWYLHKNSHVDQIK